MLFLFFVFLNRYLPFPNQATNNLSGNFKALKKETKN
jgi:hypothetical protein